MPSIQDLADIAHHAPAATWPFTAITTILFIMRTWSRFRLQKDSFGWDDLMITISWVGRAAYSIHDKIREAHGSGLSR